MITFHLCPIHFLPLLVTLIKFQAVISTWMFSVSMATGISATSCGMQPNLHSWILARNSSHTSPWRLYRIWYVWTLYFFPFYYSFITQWLARYREAVRFTRDVRIHDRFERFDLFALNVVGNDRFSCDHHFAAALLSKELMPSFLSWQWLMDALIGQVSARGKPGKPQSGCNSSSVQQQSV